ncbi:MAG TPA: hypothetical protein VL382_12030 [Terriglobales bacterium]|nr:hypothetical protein [Terriglobales bacterium]
MKTLIATLLLAAAALAQTAPATSEAPAQAPAAPGYTAKSADDHARSTSEFNAIAYMKTVLANQRDYKKKFGHYATSLMALTGGGRSFTKRMARTDRGDYTVGFHGGKDSFVVTMTPKQFDPTRRGFYMSESGNVRVQEGAPATADSEPLK